MFYFIVACTLIVLFALSYISEDIDNDLPNDDGKKERNAIYKTYNDPVPIRLKDRKKLAPATVYKIRLSEKEKTDASIGQSTQSIILDKAKLEDLQQQTRIAQKLLSEIFIEEEEIHILDSNTNNEVIEALQKLLEKETWQRKEVHNILGTNVMIGNMLEKINDYAYSKVDDIVVEEDGDTIYVTTEYKEQLI